MPYGVVQEEYQKQDNYANGALCPGKCCCYTSQDSVSTFYFVMVCYGDML